MNGTGRQDNPENIGVGDMVWLMSDNDREQAMMVTQVDIGLTASSIDIAISAEKFSRGESDDNSEYDLEARCVWRANGEPHEMVYPVFVLTKQSPMSE